MGLGKRYFSLALKALIVDGKEMVIACNNEQERNSLRVMLYRAREEYGRKMDSEIKDKFAITVCTVDERPCLRIHKPSNKISSKECYVIQDGELVLVQDTEDSLAIKRLIELMTADGKTQEEIDAAVSAARTKGM